MYVDLTLVYIHPLANVYTCTLMNCYVTLSYSVLPQTRSKLTIMCQAIQTQTFADQQMHAGYFLCCVHKAGTVAFSSAEPQEMYFGMFYDLLFSSVCLLVRFYFCPVSAKRMSTPVCCGNLVAFMGCLNVGFSIGSLSHYC